MDSQRVLIKLCEMTGKEITDVERLSGGFQNIVFRFKMNQHHCLARLTPEEKRSRDLIEAELDFMDGLKKHDIQTAEAISLNGNRVSIMVIDNKRYLLTIFQYIEYAEIDVSDLTEWNVSFFFEWGKTLAKCHLISETYIEEIKRPIWLEDSGSVNSLPELLVESEPWLIELYEELRLKLSTFPRTKQNFGLIHHDLHQGNFFVNDGQLILFDFDDCAYNWYVQDLSTSIYHALWTGGSFHPEWTTFSKEFLKHFLQGYLSIRILKEEDMILLRLFLQIRELFLYLLFQKAWDLQHLEMWQSEKLLELKTNLRHHRIPYEQELVQWENETFAGHSS